MEKSVTKQVNALTFSLLSPEQIKKIAVAKIVTPELYDVDGYPVDGGLMDLRMGAIDPGVRCRTCGGRLKECLGHPGMIELARPVIHIKYLPYIEMALKSTCEICGRVLLSEEDAKKDLKTRLKKAKDAKKCPHCNEVQDKVKLEKPYTFKSGKRRIFPSEIRERLVRVSEDDLKVLGINSKTMRPEWALLTLLLVPPVTVRPSITLDSGERSEDDLTHKLSDVIRSNQRLWENLNAGAPEVIIEDLWDLLQYHISTFFDNSIARVPPARHRSGQPLKTITERIKGKEGRIRKNLIGKRVNFSARTVISPDPNLKLNEVGVPFEIAKILTVAEKVTSMNQEKLKKLILSESYPAANYIIRPDGKRKRIAPDIKQDLVQELEVGYIVERQLQDGDIVLFNRHPSLHKASLMAHYVKVLPYRTFRMHPAVCFPYNADFDGDEMNIHGPQNEEARAEAEVLLNVESNLMSVKNNTNLLGCISDAVTGAYILSQTEISKEDAAQLLYKSGVSEFSLKKENDGKDVLMQIFPKEAGVSLGVVTSSSFGVEEGEMVKKLDKEIGRKKTLEVLKNVFAVGTDYLSRIGFTISINDMDVPEKVKMSTEKLVKDAEEKAAKIIQDFESRSLEILPGKTLEETREIKLLQILNEVRTNMGKVVKEEFPKTKNVSKMISSGAGGNMLNITQMACAVGQQALGGKRINFGYSKRTLSCFKEGDLSPRARGFIYSPFIKGLKPEEFFFCSITGRDSMMDTALRTPKSGYLYRRLANALQDLKIEYDETVRDASENIIQFKYGGDGISVSGLHKKEKISPGEAIGIITAQSFGEPSTQMALNVFHSAGVAEMQITQGLPRLIEILDARKAPSTPTMEIYLDKDNNNEESSTLFAEKIKEVKLKEIMSEISIDFSEKKLRIEVNKDALKRAHITLDKAVEILSEKIKAKRKEDIIVIDLHEHNFKEIYKIKEKIKDYILSGIKGISQVLVVKRENNYVVLTAGSNLSEILKLKGVDEKRTTTNNIAEIEEVLGIESAKKAIMNEIQKVLNSQGLDIDKRHLMLVADAMTYSGSVKGITRMGIISEKTSVLARASFETPVKHFINATKTGTKDKLASVIENIILNQPVPVGTGLPGLLVKVTGRLVPAEKEEKKKKEK